jgi:hypothetical protein
VWRNLPFRKYSTQQRPRNLRGKIRRCNPIFGIGSDDKLEGLKLCTKMNWQNKVVGGVGWCKAKITKPI